MVQPFRPPAASAAINRVASPFTLTSSVWAFVAWVGIGAVLLLGGCGPVRLGSHPEPLPLGPAEEAPFTVLSGGRMQVRADLAALLKATPARVAEAAAEVEGFGKFGFAPGASYALRPPFAGVVESVEVQVGQKVTKNQVVARIRSPELAKLRADLAKLEGDREGQVEAVARVEGLVRDGAAARRELAEAKAKLADLESNLEAARNALASAQAEATGGDLYQVRAPRDGDVLAMHVEPGQRIDTLAVRPAFIVGDPLDLVVSASFPERDAPLLDAGDVCRIFVPALGEVALPGKLTSVVRAIDAQSRSVRVVCKLDAADPRLRSEMAARALVRTSSDEFLIVPRNAVLLRRDERVVLVRTAPDVVERRLVETGMNVGDSIQILGGLKSGEEVVVEGAVLLDGELNRIL